MLEKNIKDDIKKCSRCALCVQNCPIYEIKKDENNTARGLICKLLGYDKKILTQDEIKKEFKICLGCSKCKNNCPSRVNTTQAFAYKNAHFFPSLISQRLFLKLKLLPIKLLYFLNILKKNKPTLELKSNALYFKGCITKAQHKQPYLEKIFKKGDFLCCGLPYLSSGDMKNYLKVKEHNIDLIKQASCVVFDCASCLSAVMEYPELDRFDKAKLMFFSNLIDKEQLKLKVKSNYKNKTITFHKPCHLSDADFNKIESILKSIDGINYVRMEDVNSCCGFGGSYFVFHPIISSIIALKKAKTIKKSGADLILTVCPSCTLGLRYNQLISFNFKKTLELRDFIENEIEFN